MAVLYDHALNAEQCAVDWTPMLNTCCACASALFFVEIEIVGKKMQQLKTGLWQNHRITIVYNVDKMLSYRRE